MGIALLFYKEAELETQKLIWLNAVFVENGKWGYLFVVKLGFLDAALTHIST